MKKITVALSFAALFTGSTVFADLSQCAERTSGTQTFSDCNVTMDSGEHKNIKCSTLTIESVVMILTQTQCVEKVIK